MSSKVLNFFKEEKQLLRRIMRLVLTCVPDLNNMGVPHSMHLLIPCSPVNPVTAQMSELEAPVWFCTLEWGREYSNKKKN